MASAAQVCLLIFGSVFINVRCEDTKNPVPLQEPLEQFNITSTQSTLGDAVNAFGYNLSLSMMRQDLNENVVISPTSIAGLLAMTLLGTVGKTYDELVAALGFAPDVLENRRNHEQFGSLLRRLDATAERSRTLFSSGVFAAGSVRLRAAFRDYLRRVYAGDARAVDFRDAHPTRELINQWVLSNTQGKMENFLTQPLPVDTQVVLVSALYFSGQWLRPFLPEYTASMKFKTPTKDVWIEQMLNVGASDYVISTEYGVEMISMPYNDSSTVLYALKPAYNNNSTLLETMSRLSFDKIDRLITQMEKRKTFIRFPKMDLQSKAKLEKSLKALGVQALFSPKDANFALMVESNNVTNKTEVKIISRLGDDQERDSKGLKELLDGLPSPGLHVDSVLHDVRITINEFGTEAVAATAGVLARSATLFYVDAPFYMFIRNERTRLVTFSAVIFDPTVKED